MMICIPIEGQIVDFKVCSRFGRCRYFIGYANRER